MSGVGRCEVRGVAVISVGWGGIEGEVLRLGIGLGVVMVEVRFGSAYWCGSGMMVLV